MADVETPKAVPARGYIVIAIGFVWLFGELYRPHSDFVWYAYGLGAAVTVFDLLLGIRQLILGWTDPKYLRPMWLLLGVFALAASIVAGLFVQVAELKDHGTPHLHFARVAGYEGLIAALITATIYHFVVRRRRMGD